MLERIFNGSRHVSSLLNWTGLLVLLGISFLLGIEVLIRKLFNITLGGADEIAGYMFAFLAGLAFTVTALDKANIRIDILYNFFPRNLKIVVDLLSQVALLIFVVPFTWQAAAMAISSFERGSRSTTALAVPLAIPQGLWATALIIFVVVLVLMLLVSIAALVRGDIQKFNRLASPVSEIEEGEQAIKEVEPDPDSVGHAGETK